ncbi:MAG: class I SAM-dependent RNA methyltransferase [Acidimicrobiales bacterium]
MTNATTEGSATVRIERPAVGGGVAHAPDGRVTFVRGALPGELVEASFLAGTTAFARGVAGRVIEPSPQRVAPPCAYAVAGGCGGCDLQHADETLQRSWKAAVTHDQLRRIAGLDLDVAVTAPPAPARASRTRLRCAVDRSGHLALRAWRSHRRVALDACWLLDDRASPAFATTWSRARQVEVRAIGDGEPFAVVWPASGRGPYGADLAGRRLRTRPVSHVSVAEWDFTVGATSFWQSHVDAPALLVDRVLRASSVDPGDRVVDLFSGVGLFSVPLASRVGSTGAVIAVESAGAAVADARRNAAAHPTVSVRRARVAPDLVEQIVLANDVVVLDPPRTGLPRGVAAAIARQRPRRVVYVSCDAATLARDLTEFLAGGFVLVSLEILDLFPMTEHVELVALLDMPGSVMDSATEGHG